jgi:hypothetical protein
MPKKLYCLIIVEDVAAAAALIIHTSARDKSDQHSYKLRVASSRSKEEYSNQKVQLKAVSAVCSVVINGIKV